MEVLESWLKGKGNPRHYRSVLDMYRCFAGCDSFDDLLSLPDPRGMIMKWRASLELAPASLNTYASRVRSFYDFYEVDVGKVARMRQRTVRPHKILTVDEVKAMMDHADIRDKALIWLLYSSGARIASCLKLNVGRLNFRDKPPLRLHFYPRETKFGVEYDTFVSGEAVDALREYLEWRRRRGLSVEPDSPMFLDKYRNRLSYEASRFNMHVILGKAGIVLQGGERLCHHSFRAAFQRNLQVAGVNQFVIEKLMGHSVEQTVTGRYSIGLTVQDLRDAYGKASWGLEVSEARVQELEAMVDETKKVLGDQAVSRARLEASYEERIRELEKAYGRVRDLDVLLEDPEVEAAFAEALRRLNKAKSSP